MGIENRLKEYIMDFGEINNLEGKIKELKSVTCKSLFGEEKPYENENFLLEGIIREDLEEKGIKNLFLQNMIIFKYIGEVHSDPCNPIQNYLDEKVTVYQKAIDVFGEDLKEIIKEDPMALFKRNAGEKMKRKDYQMIYRFLMF